VPEWLYQREKLPRQDVIRDVQLYGSLMHLHLADVIIVVNLRLHIRCVRIADSTRALKLSKRMLNNAREERRNYPSLLF
jgi:hypothetical protein